MPINENDLDHVGFDLNQHELSNEENERDFDDTMHEVIDEIIEKLSDFLTDADAIEKSYICENFEQDVINYLCAQRIHGELIKNLPKSFVKEICMHICIEMDIDYDNYEQDLFIKLDTE